MRFMIGSCDEELRAVRSRTKGPPAARSGYGRTHLFSKHNERGRSPAVKRFFQNCLLLAFVDVRGSCGRAGACVAAIVIVARLIIAMLLRIQFIVTTSRDTDR